MNRRSSLRIAASLCTIALAACSPPPPTPDASGNDASAESSVSPDVSRPDVAADRPSLPDAAPDVSAVPDAAPDASETSDAAMDAAPDVSADATVEAGMDAIADAAPDALADATPDAASDAATFEAGPMPLCMRGVDGVLTLPALGASTMTTTTLAAMGVGGMNSGFSCGFGTTGGSERVFALDISTRSTVEISVSAAVAATDTVLAIRRDCALSTTEVACNDDDSGSRNSRVRAPLDPGRYYVVLDEFGAASSATGGDVTLTVSNVAIAANATCATPTTLARGVALTESLRDGLVDTMTCRSLDNGPQRFYRYTIPAGQEATFTASAAMGTMLLPVVRVFADCATRATCLADAGGSSDATAVARFSNSGATARDVIVSVGSASPTVTGSYTIVADHAAIPTAPANASCATPTALPTTGVAISGTTAGATEARDAFCAVRTTGSRSVYYSVVIPNNQTVVVTAAATSAGFRPVIRAIRNCAAASCLFDSFGFARTTTSASYTNRTGADLSILVAVQGLTDSERGTFDLSAQLLPPSANNTCATATPLVIGTPLRNQAQQSSSTLTSATCANTSTGPVLYYSLSVPAMTAVRVRAVPLTPADPVLRVRADCATVACEAFGDRGLFAEDESVTVRNSNAAARTYIVELSSNDAASAGVFDVSASTFVDAYTLTPLAAASCRTLPATATDTGLMGDDTTLAAPVALPFAMQYFRESATHFSVNSNGMGQLFSSMSGTPSNAYSNLTLPESSAPSGAVAVFWDDQRLDSMPMQGVRYATMGTAPNRELVIEYFASSYSPANSLRYQWVLFETTNVMEFHYCAMTGPMGDLRHTGDSATIGLQSFDGSQGLTFATDTANAIGGGTLGSPNAIRWTPR